MLCVLCSLMLMRSCLQDEQVQQRQSNLDELAKLGVEIYPRTLRAAAHDLGSWSTRYGERTHDELEAERIETITSGRILAIRVVRQGELPRAVRRPRQDPGLHPAGLAAGARLPDLQAARFRRLGRRRGPPVPDQDQRAHDLGVAAALPRRSACCRCRRSGTGSPTSRSATASATSISSSTRTRGACSRRAAASSRRSASS